MGKELTNQIFNQQRQILGEILPLTMPLSIQIQVTNLCNFKCFYCSACQPVEKRKKQGLLLQHMPFEDFKQCIDSISKAGVVKVINLVGWGEPLLHPDIADMVRYIKKKSAASFVRIVSNGSLLTPKLSDALIEAGLDNLRISLQGITERDYQEVSKIKIDFEEFVDNIRYFYKNRKQSTISLKIMDIMIKGKNAEFGKIFGSICNECLVDTLAEINEGIDVHGHGSNLNKTHLGGDFLDTEICSVPFFRAFIDVDCRLFPCCHLPMPCKFGDVRKDFYDVWNGKERAQFLLNLLKGNQYKFCANCKMYLNQLLPSDKLDDYRDELIAKYKALLADAEKRDGAQHE